MRTFICLLIWVNIAQSAWATQPENAWRSLGGTALQKSFAGQELGDGTHYAYRFKSNGSFAGTEMARDVRGTWKTTASQICWTWIKPAGSEECYSVRRSGNDIRMFRNGYEAFSGTLTPIETTK